jgi:hypothetical protein
MSQHLPLAVLLRRPPGNEMPPPTQNPKPMRGVAFYSYSTQLYGNKTAGL